VGQDSGLDLASEWASVHPALGSAPELVSVSDFHLGLGSLRDLDSARDSDSAQDSGSPEDSATEFEPASRPGSRPPFLLPLVPLA